MSGDLVIARLDGALVMLREAKNIQDTKKVLDVAAAAETFALRQKLSQESIDYAHDIKIEALAQLGRMLRDAPDAKPGPKSELGNREEPNYAPSLSDLGLDKKTSSIAQRLAKLPLEQFEQVKAGTSSIAQAIREVTHAQRKAIDPPIGKYRVIYADPPWSYGNSGVINDDNYGRAARHYPSMTIDELCALPVEEITEDNAVLFMWVTSPLLEECFPVIRAWGFNYKTSFVWDKVKHNFGHYNSVRHELLLVCTRGSCTPDVPTLIDSVQSIERTDRHSEKPEDFRTIVDTLYPNGARIELFARAESAGWETWGNEQTSIGA